MNSVTSAIAVLLVLVASVSCNDWSTVERSFLPANKNLSCSQCETRTTDLSPRKDYTEWKMKRELCIKYPEQFFKPCDNTKMNVRGCGKTISVVKVPGMNGRYQKKVLVSRYCATTDKDECTTSAVVNGDRTTCTCSGNNCNSARTIGGSILSILSFVSMVLAHSILA